MRTQNIGRVPMQKNNVTRWACWWYWVRQQIIENNKGNVIFLFHFWDGKYWGKYLINIWSIVHLLLCLQIQKAKIVIKWIKMTDKQKALTKFTITSKLAKQGLEICLESPPPTTSDACFITLFKDVFTKRSLEKLSFTDLCTLHRSSPDVYLNLYTPFWKDTLDQH